MTETTVLEKAPEDILIGAVLGNDDPKGKLGGAQDVDDDEDDLRTEQQAEADGEEPKQRKEEPKEAATQGDPEEDFVEIAGAEGEEPVRHKLADVMAGYQEYKKLEGRVHEVVAGIEREATQVATQRLQQIEQAGTQTVAMVQAVLQVIGQPTAPNPDELLNPNSPKYDPDNYHMQMARYQRAMQQQGYAQQMAQQLMQQVQAAQQQATEERETAELRQLQRDWPEFPGQVATKFVDDMVKAYGTHGVTQEGLDEALTHSWMALVARDALAYRAMKASGKEVRAKVGQAPKLVRSKQEAKGSARSRDQGGRFVGDALTRLKTSHSDADAAAFFSGLVKAGRL